MFRELWPFAKIYKFVRINWVLRKDLRMNQNIEKHLNHILKNLGFDSSGVDITITGCEPVTKSPWHIGEASATALSAMATLISKIYDIRTGSESRQGVEIDLNIAALSTLRCAFMRNNGYEIPFPDIEYPCVGLYEAKDGKWVFINGGFPRLRRGLLKVLQCADNAEDIARAVKQWDAYELEKTVQEAHLCCVVCRSSEEWEKTEQGKALREALTVNGMLMPIEIEKIADGAPQPFVNNGGEVRPLSGIKMLDLTHVLAGPTCGMMLAEQGANVMRINPPHVPYILPFLMDTSQGKRNTMIDLREEHGKESMWKLIDDGADVFSESFRPGTFEKYGFGASDIAQRLSKQGKGIVYASINCYGHHGPWKEFPGWEQLAQTATGLNMEQGENGVPGMLPTYPNDYITGYLAAVGVLAALIKREKEGGSYMVKVSLAQTAMWLQSFGKFSKSEIENVTLDLTQLSDYMLSGHSGHGFLEYFGHPVRYTMTKAFWEKESVPAGYHPPTWE